MPEKLSNIVVFSDCAEGLAQANTFAEAHSLQICHDDLAGIVSASHYALCFSAEGVKLVFLENKKLRELQVSFISGAKNHRRKYGGGKGQAIAKAIGLNNAAFKPTVLDATAGQGGDAFVLATLGCEVTMLERSPIAFVMLEAALQQARIYAEDADGELQSILSRLSLFPGNIVTGNSVGSDKKFDVVYLDPMFPERKKSALVKKEMRVFHDVIGPDSDADQLLPVALELAQYRVVVKRPNISPFLGDKEPTYQLKGKSSRFDVYVNKSMREV